MRYVKVIATLLAFLLIQSCTQDSNHSTALPTQGPTDVSGLELVMPQSSKIQAKTAIGVIEIVAGDGLLRSYSWNGGTRSMVLSPRVQRWFGSFGAYNPGSGNEWAEHDGITRGVLQEGQQHFDNLEDAEEWVKGRTRMFATVYRNDGLVVSFEKVLSRRQLNVEVWQVFIKRRKPVRLEGSQDDLVSFSTECLPPVKHDVKEFDPDEFYRVLYPKPNKTKKPKARENPGTSAEVND